MIIEISNNSFYTHFPNEPHPFLRKAFIELNSYKVDQVFYLIQDVPNPNIGLIAGLKDNVLLSPFSAPFGGFHYDHENIYVGEIDVFIQDLKNYLITKEILNFHLTFPPSIYGPTFNSKIISSLIRNSFKIEVPDLTNWIDLNKFDGRFKQRNSREYYNQSLRNHLRFSRLVDNIEMEMAFELIASNRKMFGRPFYMNFKDILYTSEIWPIDFFGVYSSNSDMVSAGIFYNFPKGIAYAAYWGDNLEGRKLRAMDFLSFNLWLYYKTKNFSFIDLGISTENGGVPNEGLLRFKESHEALTEIKHKISWTG